MPIFAVTAALPGRAPEMLAAAGEVRSGRTPSGWSATTSWRWSRASTSR